MSSRSVRPEWILVAVALLLLASADGRPQGYQQAPYRDDLFRPLRNPRRGPAPPDVVVDVRQRISLADAPDDVRLLLDDGGRVVFATVEGWVIVDSSSGSSVPPISTDASPFAEPTTAATWVEGGKKGKLRFRVESEGELVAQRRCSSDVPPRYCKKWRLRLPGQLAGPPVAIDARVFVGSTDARIYGLRARNGHRIWAKDLEARVGRPLGVWTGTLPARPDGGDEPIVKTFDLVLAVPDHGRSMIILDPHDGSTLGRFRPEREDDRLATAAIALGDGGIAVVRQGWQVDDVELLLLDLSARPFENVPAASEEDP